MKKSQTKTNFKGGKMENDETTEDSNQKDEEFDDSDELGDDEGEK